MLQAGDILDGYRLIRTIGRGGFGEVWLCQLEATGEYKALKFLSARDSSQIEQELKALIRYRVVASQIQCHYLVPIEHVNRVEHGLFYTMPLADGASELAVDDSRWKPRTLAAVIDTRKTAPMWFTPEEVQSIMLPLIEVAQKLSDAGVIHRDIKPENILFIGGRPCLGDVSLLAGDVESITRRGTPGYAAPSWYLESGGNPDMWGLATTFYTLITGNAPDKMGRAAYRWPPQGKENVDVGEWTRFFRIIYRATNEYPGERYLHAKDLLTQPPQTGERFSSIRFWGRRWVAWGLAFCMVLVWLGWMFKKDTSLVPIRETGQPPTLADAKQEDSPFEKALLAARARFLPPRGHPACEKFKKLMSDIGGRSNFPKDVYTDAFKESEVLFLAIHKELDIAPKSEIDACFQQLNAQSSTREQREAIQRFQADVSVDRAMVDREWEALHTATKRLDALDTRLLRSVSNSGQDEFQNEMGGGRREFAEAERFMDRGRLISFWKRLEEQFLK